MQQPQQRVEHRGQHRSGMSESLGELHLGHFDVPVAELVPREVVERLAGPTEFIAVECRINFRANFFQPPQNPAIGVGQVGHVGQRRRGGTVEQREPCGIEQLGHEIARRPDGILADGQVTTGAGARGRE